MPLIMGIVLKRHIRPSLARQARSLPVAWRLLAVGFLGAVLGYVSPWLPLAACLVAVVLIWDGLNKLATRYCDQPATRSGPARLTAFASGLTLLASFLILAMSQFHWLLGDSEYWSTLVMIGAMGIAALLFWALFRNGWRWYFGLIAFVAVGAALTLGMQLEVHPHQAQVEMLTRWMVNLVRLSLVCALAGVLAELASRHPFAMKHSALLMTRSALTFAMILALSLLLIAPTEKAVEDTVSQTVWGMVAVVYSASLAIIVFKGTTVALRDFEWLSRLLKVGWGRSGPAPRGMYASLAFTPVVFATDYLPWKSWLWMLLLAMTASFLHGARSWLERNWGRAQLQAPPEPTVRDHDAVLMEVSVAQKHKEHHISLQEGHH